MFSVFELLFCRILSSFFIFHFIRASLFHIFILLVFSLSLSLSLSRRNTKLNFYCNNNGMIHDYVMQINLNMNI